MKLKSTAVSGGKKFYISLFIAAAAGFLLRLFTARELGAVNGGINSVFTPSPASDLCTYMRLAEEIASGKYKGVFYYQPFYYAVFLPVIRLIAGAGVWKVIFCQSLLGGATAYFAGLAGARIFGRRAGIFSAWMTAISVPLLLYAPFHQNETLQTFNITLLFYLVLTAYHRKNGSWWFLAGLTAGIGILTRGNLWFLVPPVLAAAVFSARRNRKMLISSLLLFLIPLFLVQLPFAAWNTKILGKVSGPSTAADAVLALGNTPEAPAGGRNTGLPAGPMEYPESYHRAMAKTQQGISVPRQMLEWLICEPASFLELQFRKLLLFWYSGEIPNNVSLYGEGRYSFVLRNMYPGDSAVLLALGVAGLLLFCRRAFAGGKTALMLLYCFIILYWWAVSAFYILSRFRAPVIPLVTIAGGGFLTVYLAALRHDRKRFLRLTVLLLAGVWITSFAYDFYRYNCERAVMRIVRTEGTILPAQPGYPETRLDHGPFTFGSWTTVELVPGTLLEKRFTSSGNSVIWSILSPAAGELVCRIPGEPARIVTLKSGMNEMKLPLSGDRALLEILSAPHGAAAVFDRQRDHSRSRLNGGPLSGEWVVRMNCDRSGSSS